MTFLFLCKFETFHTKRLMDIFYLKRRRASYIYLKFKNSCTKRKIAVAWPWRPTILSPVSWEVLSRASFSSHLYNDWGRWSLRTCGSNMLWPHRKWAYSVVFNEHILTLIPIFISPIPNQDKLKTKMANPSRDTVGQKSGNPASFCLENVSQTILTRYFKQLS